MRFQPDSSLKAAVTRGSLQARGSGHRICGRVANLRARSDDGDDGNEHDGRMGGPGGGGARGSEHDYASRAAQMMGINGRSFAMDRVDVTAKLGTSEIWEIQSAAMAHPFHVHGASFRILSNNGRPPVRLGRPRSRRAHPRGIDVVVVFNALRLLTYRSAKSRCKIRMSRAVPALNVRRSNHGQ